MRGIRRHGHVNASLAAAVVAMNTVTAAQGADRSPTSASADAARTSVLETTETMPPARPFGESLSGQAKADYAAGKSLFLNHDYAGAILKLKLAYEQSADPRILWDMAACEKKLGHYAQMHRLLSRYLAEGQSMFSTKDRQAAERALETIQRLVSQLRIDVNVPGAEVRVDGVMVGVSPLSQPVLVDLGLREIRITKVGYQPFFESIVPVGGNVVQLQATLEQRREQSRLVVVASNATAIELNGTVVGKKKWEGTVAPGLYRIRVTAPDKKTYETEAWLKDGETRRFQVSLEARNRNTWVWLAGGAALVTGLVVGGYFVFRPDDVRTPSGVLGTAEAGLIVR